MHQFLAGLHISALLRSAGSSDSPERQAAIRCSQKAKFLSFANCQLPVASRLLLPPIFFPRLTKDLPP